MSTEDLHMDNQFRKAAGEQKFAYSHEFWKEVRAQLDDASLDAAFQSAAGVVAFMPDLNLSEAVNDAFLDEAFKSASENTTLTYDSNFWNQFLKERDLIEQDSAYADASNSVIADYHPVFWSDADIALQNEGLHFEYKAAYWKDAKQLLDRSDRKTFFFRWSSVAILLLLLSAGGIYQSLTIETNPLAEISQGQSNLLAVHSESDLKNSVNLGAPAVLENKNNPANSDSGNGGVNLTNTDLTFEGSFSMTENKTTNSDATVQDVTVQDNSINIHADNSIVQDGNITNMSAVVISDDSDNGNNTSTSASVNLQPIESDLTLNSISENLSETNLASENSSINLTSLPKTSIMRPNSEINSEYFGPKIEVKKYQLKPTHTVSFIGQAGIGNKYSVPEFVPSLRTSIGVEYKRSGFGKLRNFEFGGIVSMNHIRQNDFGTERRVNVFNLQGGMDKFWYKLQLKDMIYANVSGLATYKINSRHSLRLTMGIDYLVFVQSNMSYKVSADAGITTVNNNWGVKDGLNKIDLRGGVGYEFGLTSRLGLQLNSSFGFFDRSDNSFIDDKSFDHEMNVTVGLKYTFLRKI